MFKLLTFFFLFTISFVNSQGILDGFKLLKLPRNTIPLGAEWINGIGVNGDGVSEANIIVNKSLTSLQIDKEFKQGLDLSILNYFNLDASYLNNTTIYYNNLTIYTVKDISKIDISTGQLVVYECIRADSITFKVNKTIDGKLNLKLDEKVKDLKITGKTNYNNGVKFSGEKLFLAYRVFELGKTKVVSKTAKIKDTQDGGGLREVNLLQYQIKFNDHNLYTCINPSKIPIDPSIFAICSEKVPIEVIIYDFNNTVISGKPFTDKTSINNNTYKSWYFTKRKNNILVTDFIEIRYIIKNSSPMLFFYMDSKSKVIIKRMETNLKMFKNPEAPGWN